MNQVFKRALCSFKSGELLVHYINSAVVITLNRPNSLNAINENILLKLQQTLRTSELTKKLVVLKGNDRNVFSCGGDVKWLNNMMQTNRLEEGKQCIKIEYQTIYMTKYYKLPYIALIDGLIMGAGLGLSMHGRYRIATEKTMAAMPESRIGLLTDVSGTYFLPRLPRNFGIYMALTGIEVKGKSAVSAGIATHFVPRARMPELEKGLMQCTDEAQVERIVEQFHEPVANQTPDENIDHIERCFGAATIEEIIGRLESVQSDWSRRVLKTLTEASPGCMKITLRAIQRGAQMNLAQCLQMEFRINTRRCLHHDFAEGIRTILVEKKNKPKWTPATLKEVTQAHVERYLEKFPPDQELDLETPAFSME